MLDETELEVTRLATSAKNELKTAIEPKGGGQDWREDLTASMRANCIAPSDDVIQRCFDLYVDELHAPILELEDELVDLSAEVSDGFAALESLLPQEMRQALSRRAAELAYDGEENPEW